MDIEDIEDNCTYLFLRDNVTYFWSWCEFPKYNHLPFAVSVSVMAFFGLMGNTLIILMSFHEGVSRYSYSVYLRAAAISDTMVLIRTATEDILEVFELEQKFKAYSLHGCKIWGLAAFTTKITSPFFIVALSMDRCIAIWMPFQKARFCSKKFATIVCLSIVCLTMTLTVPLQMQSTIVEHHEGWIECEDNLSPTTLHMVMPLYTTLPCILLLLLNSLVVIRIKQSRNFIKSQAQQNKFTGKRATLPLILIAFLAFITLFPISLTEVVEVISEENDDEFDVSDQKNLNLTWSICNIIYLVNFAQNFYILIGSSAHYRKMLKEVLCCSYRPSARQRHVVVDTVQSKCTVRTIESDLSRLERTL